MRDLVVARALLRHLASQGAQGDFTEVVLEGGARDGCLIVLNEPEDGDIHVLTWDAQGVVGLAFDHNSPESQAGLDPAHRTPEACVEDAPTELNELVRRAAAATGRLATAGVWILGEQLRDSPMTDVFDPYLLGTNPMLAAWFGRDDLSPGQLALVRAAETRLAAGEPVMPDELDDLLTQDSGC